jgi:lipid-A-disaccharide synthase
VVGARPTAIERRVLCVGIVAGEPSGDLLGAGLMRALRAQVPDIRFRGVGGPLMLQQGLESLAPLSTFAMNGFVEPFKRFPDLLRVIRKLRSAFLADRPDVFVGVDFNVFNLLLERLLKRRGITTVHYVSPSVYAWRRGRVKRIGRAADLVMTLYPFEPPLYAQHDVRAEFVGHPLADEIEPVDTTASARAALGIAANQLTIALLPGSRMSEIRAHGELFMQTAVHIDAAAGRARYLIPCVDERSQLALEELVRRFPELDVRVLRGDAHRALASADVALVKSGTGALEAMLFGKPMVVTYRLGALSYRIVKALLRTPFVALPNILAGRRLVPELLQHDAQPERLARAVIAELERGRSGAHLTDFRALHWALRRGANQRAAAAVLSMIDR